MGIYTYVHTYRHIRFNKYPKQIVIVKVVWCNRFFLSIYESK